MKLIKPITRRIDDKLREIHPSLNEKQREACYILAQKLTIINELTQSPEPNSK